LLPFCVGRVTEVPFETPSRRGATPGGKGKFPGYDVLQEAYRWDDVTTGVVLARLEPDTDFAFFTPTEQAAAEALCDQLLAQWEEPKIPVIFQIDHRLALGETDGWHYDDLPEDGEGWRRSLAALDDEARDQCGQPFYALSRDDQATIVQGIQDADQWRGFNAKRLWSLWTRYVCAAFYAHPWAWNEIGFGGPAYPRGYKNRGIGSREEWEVREAGAQDPVPWATKREEARRAHQRKVEP
jgi:hypothetical protein